MRSVRWPGRIQTILAILVVVGTLAACGGPTNTGAPGATPTPYGGY